MKKSILPLLLLSAIASTAPAALIPVTLVDDRFIDGGVTNGADAKDLSWALYTTSASNTPSITSPVPQDNTTGLNEGNNDFALEVKVAGQGFRGVYGVLSSATTLFVGQSLSLSYDLRFLNGVSNETAGVRFGLYDSLGTASVTDDAGYLVRMSTGTATASARGWQETGTADTILGGGDLTEVTVGSGTGYTSLTTTTVNIGLVLTMVTGTTMRMDLYQNNNKVWTTTDTTSIYRKFDTIAIGTGGNIYDYRIDNILLTGVVPEPSSFGVVAGAGLFIIRRRRVKK